jgi:hypothetical protein
MPVRREPLHREQLAVLATVALLTTAAWALTLSQIQAMVLLLDEVVGPAVRLVVGRAGELLAERLEGQARAAGGRPCR